MAAGDASPAGDREMAPLVGTTPAMPPTATPGGGLRSPHASDDADDAAADRAATQATADTTDYTRARFTLMFRDAAVERGYLDFQYVDGGGYGAKLYAAAAIAIWALTTTIYHHGAWHPKVSGAMFTDGHWATATAGLAVTVLVLGLLFVPRLAPYREYFFLLLVAVHWPTFALSATFAWDARTSTPLVYMSGCFYFCTHVAMPRFAFMAVFLLLAPLLTLAVSTTVDDSHWGSSGHSRFEMHYWLLPIFPLAMLPFFETRSRDAYVSARRAQHAMQVIEVQSGATKHTIARLFPPTPTMCLLAVGGEARAFALRGTVLVQSDIAGFTSWMSHAVAEEAIATVRRMFEEFEEAALRYNVEKVSTVGDSFIGAVFDPAVIPRLARRHRSRRGNAKADLEASSGSPPTELDAAAKYASLEALDYPLAARAVDAAQFAVTILHTLRADKLKLRIGVAHGDVIGAFVGRAPPKFDVFDPSHGSEPSEASSDDKARQAALNRRAVEHTATLEQTGAPGRVHMAIATVAAMAEEAVPNDPETSAIGFLFDSLMPGGADAFERPRLAQAVVDDALRVSELLCGLCEMEVAADVGSAFDTSSSDDQGDGAQHDARHVPVNAGWGGEFGGLAASHRSERDREDEAELARITEDYALSPWRLRFLSEGVETRYLEWLRRQRFPRHIQAILLAQGFFLLSAEAGMAPCPSATTKGHQILACLTLALLGVMLYVDRLSATVQAVLLHVGYAVIAIAAFTMVDTACVTPDQPFQRVRDAGIVVGFWSMFQLVLCGQLMPGIPFAPWRLLLVVGAAVFYAAVIALRRTILEDEAQGYDMGSIVGTVVGYGFVGFFADFSLRRGFQSRRTLNAMLRTSRGRLAEVVARASDVMLPRFVTDAMLRRRIELRRARDLQQQQQQQQSAGDDMGAESLMGTSTMMDGSSTEEQLRAALFGSDTSVDPDDAGDDVRTSTMLWRYDFPVAIAFVEFDEAALAARARRIAHAERLLATADGVQKIKSVGPKLLLASGIAERRGTSTGLALSDAAHAAAALVRFAETLRSELAEVAFTPPERDEQEADRPGAIAGPATTDSTQPPVRIGIHAGPCVGAVIGSTGVTFDIFGDAVNTAARIQASASTGSVLLSEACHRLLHENLSTAELAPTVEIEPAAMKGKGRMRRFAVERR